MLQTGAAWLLVAGIVALVVWGIHRGKKGYGAVQSLMAQVEAHASADARASALASNAVHFNVGGYRTGDDDDLDDEHIGRLVHIVASRLGIDPGVASDALGSGVRPGAGRLVAGPALRHEGAEVIR